MSNKNDIFSFDGRLHYVKQNIKWPLKNTKSELKYSIIVRFIKLLTCL